MAKIDEKEMEIPKTTDRKIIALMQVGGLQSVRSQHNRTIHFSEGTSCYTIQNTWLQKTSATFLLPHTHTKNSIPATEADGKETVWVAEINFDLIGSNHLRRRRQSVAPTVCIGKMKGYWLRKYLTESWEWYPFSKRLLHKYKYLYKILTLSKDVFLS